MRPVKQASSSPIQRRVSEVNKLRFENLKLRQQVLVLQNQLLARELQGVQAALRAQLQTMCKESNAGPQDTYNEESGTFTPAKAIGD